MHSYASSSTMAGSSWFAELLAKARKSLPAHVAARAADSVSVGADADIPVFCAPQIFRSRLAFVSRAADELAAAARAALSDRGSPLLPGREVRHHLLDVLHLPAGPDVRAAYQSMGGPGLQLAVMSGPLAAVTASPRRAVPGWPRWPGLPGVCPAGQGPGSPSSGSRPVTTMRLRPGWARCRGPAPGRQTRGARRGCPARTAPGPWPGSRARLASFAGRAGRVT